MFNPRQEMESLSSEETEPSQISMTDNSNNILIYHHNETIEIGEEKGDFIGQFFDRVMREKKDVVVLILSLGGLNVIQCAIIVLCGICSVCGGGDKKDAQDPEKDGNDSFAMDKRATFEANECMFPIVELNAENFSQIEAGAQLEQVQVLAILDEVQQQNKIYF